MTKKTSSRKRIDNEPNNDIFPVVQQSKAFVSICYLKSSQDDEKRKIKLRLLFAYKIVELWRI